MSQAFPAPAWDHAAEAFIVAHAAGGAWSDGTAVKYRQTLAALGGRLAEAGSAAVIDVALLSTAAGTASLDTAFTITLRLAVASGVRGLHALACMFSRGAAVRDRPCSALWNPAE